MRDDLAFAVIRRDGTRGQGVSRSTVRRPTLLAFALEIASSKAEAAELLGVSLSTLKRILSLHGDTVDVERGNGRRLTAFEQGRLYGLLESGALSRRAIANRMAIAKSTVSRGAKMAFGDEEDESTLDDSLPRTVAKYRCASCGNLVVFDPCLICRSQAA